MALTHEVRLFDTTGARQPLPTRFIAGWWFELLALGGCGSFTLDLVAELDDVQIPVLPDDDWRVEVWLNSIPVYRGWIEKPEPAIDLGEPSTHYEGVGAMGRTQSLLADCVYAKGYGADVIEAFGWFSDNFLADKPGQSERLGTVVRAIAGPIGLATGAVDATNADVRSVFDQLAQASQGLLMWGWDFTAEGDDRLWVQQRPTGVTDEDYRLRAGKDVRYISQPTDLAEVTNAVKLIGGAAASPNLAYNSSFELVVTPGTGEPGNLLADGSFEVLQGSGMSPWSWPRAASQQPAGNRQGLYARTGVEIAELETGGDAIVQTVDLGGTVPVGTGYLAVTHHATEQATGSRSYKVRLEALDAGGTRLEYLIDDSAMAPIAVTARGYQQWTSNVVKTTVSGCAKLRLSLLYFAGSGINNEPYAMIDDVWLYRADAVGQDGWEEAKATTAGTGAAVMTWGQMRDESQTDKGAYHGAYCVRAVVSGANDTDGNAVWIRPTSDRWIQARALTIYNVQARYRSGATIGLRLGLELQHQDKSITRIWSSEFYTNTAKQWTLSPTFQPETDLQTTLIRPIIEVRQNGQVEVDAVDVFEAGIDNRTVYLPGSNLELYFRSDNAAPGVTLTTVGGGDPHGLTAAALASIATWGLREKVVRVDAITDLGQFKAYAAGYLNQYCAPKVQGQLFLDPVDVLIRHVGDDVNATPQGFVAVSGFQTPQPSIEGGQFPDRITYSLQQPGEVRCEIDLTNRRPDAALLIQQTTQGSSVGAGGATIAPGMAAGGNGDASTTGTIPLGGVILWTGSVGSIPAGWTLCDGSTVNGIATPDLRDRFVIGAGGSLSPGATGGGGAHNHGFTGGQHTDMATLGITDHPAHNHHVGVGVASGITNTTADVTTVLDGSGATITVPSQTHDHSFGVDPFDTDTLAAQTHTGTGHQHGLSGASSDSTSAPPPPYYALCYICRVS